MQELRRHEEEEEDEVQSGSLSPSTDSGGVDSIWTLEESDGDVTNATSNVQHDDDTSTVRPKR